MKKKLTQGGARPGAGAKLKYGEPTERIYINIPASKKEDILPKIKAILKKFEIKRT